MVLRSLQLVLWREGDAPEVLQVTRVRIDELNSIGAESLDGADLRHHARVGLSAAHVSDYDC